MPVTARKLRFPISFIASALSMMMIASSASAFISSSKPAWLHRRVFSTVLKVTSSSNGMMLTKTRVWRMKVSELRHELGLRGLSTAGLRGPLVRRLLDATGPAEPSTLLDYPVHNTMEPSDEFHLDLDHTFVLRFRGQTTSSFGAAGVGVALFDDTNGREIWVAQQYLIGMSKFEAEYRALTMGLNYARRRGVKQLIIQCDNDVMIKQLKGGYEINKESLQRLYWSAFLIMEDAFSSVEMQHISTAKNSRALVLARTALGTRKSFGIHSLMEDRNGAEGVEGTPSTEISLGDYSISPEEVYLLRVDGGARGNPGIAGAGVVIYDSNDEEVWCGWKFIDRATNNVAEYSSLLFGLHSALALGITRLSVESDSLLVVKQLDGTYKVKDSKLKKLYNAVVDEIQRFASVSIQHIPRNQNRRADELANQAMDTKASHGFEDGAGHFERFSEKAASQQEVSLEKRSISPEETYVLRIDGGSRGNPGIAGAGMVIYDSNEREIWHGWKYLDRATNNVAEYLSLLFGVRSAAGMGITQLSVESDSLLVVKQLEGTYQVKDSKLKRLYNDVVDEMERFASISIQHIPRDKNWRADELANQAMDTKASQGFEDERLFEKAASPQGFSLEKRSISPEEASHKRLFEKAGSQQEFSLEKRSISPESISPEETYVLRIDGGSRGNPGIAGAGMVIYDSNEREIWHGWKYLDTATNNVAEYSSLLFGLRYAAGMGIIRLTVESDSLLVVKQLEGTYQVKDSKLKKLYNAVVDEMDNFTSVSVHHIPRDKNRRADELANQAMDTKGSHGLTE